MIRSEYMDRKDTYVLSRTFVESKFVNAGGGMLADLEVPLIISIITCCEGLKVMSKLVRWYDNTYTEISAFVWTS